MKITKKYTFSSDEVNQLKDIQVGLVSANATVNGLNIYKNVLLDKVFKRCEIDGDPKKGNTKSITYNLSKNEILYTEEPIKKNGLAKE